jgi:tetratricopeptide (TPR) repeat protein
MGSGKHALTFLHRNSRGALIELPLGWYAEKGGYFAMNPGFDNPQPATRRKIDYDCMSCHNAAPRIPAGHAAPGSEPLYSGDLPEGIDCQRCHGPGGRHLAAARAAGSRVESIRKAIVNPSRLSPDRQNDTCLQCHLETTSGRLPSMIRRFEREPFSYKPGEPLEQFTLHFDHAPGTGRADKFEIVSSAYRLRKSACYLKSSALTCTTCHNPHAKSEAAGCGKCHNPKELLSSGKHPAGADCASCHMPKRRTEDAVHVVMTDHFIQRRPPLVDWLAERQERHLVRGEEYRGEVVPYLQGDFLYNAVAQVLQGSNLEAGIPRLVDALRLRQPQEAEYYVTLGNGWQQAQRPDKAAEAFEEALRLAPGSGRVLRFLGIASQESGKLERAREVLSRAIQIDPSDAVAWHQLGLLDSAAGRPQDAAKKAAKAIVLDPDLLDARNSLGASLASLGDRAGSEKAFRDALRIDPYFATAHGNLARLLATNGAETEALSHFATAVRLRPDFAPDRYEYALALVRANRPAEARIQVDAALRVLPILLEARILSGGLWAKEQKLELARKDYEEALRIQPDSGRAHLDLARVLIAQGDRVGTITHLSAAAKGSDGASAKLAIQALRNIGASPE